MLTPTTPKSINATANAFAAGLRITPRFPTTGVTATVELTAQQYYQPTVGAPQKIGDPAQITFGDIFAAANPTSGLTDPAAAVLSTAIAAAFTAFMASGTPYPPATVANQNPQALAAAITVIETAIQLYVTATKLI